MTHGVTATLQELIALRRYAHHGLYFAREQSRTAGSYLSTKRGRGMEFAEVRNYQAGDEIRHMEWRVTARTGRPHVKTYHEERERPIMLLLDFNPSMYFGTRHTFKSVAAARLAALFAWQALYQGDKVGGILFSSDTHHEFLPTSREAAFMRFLAKLADYTKCIPEVPHKQKTRPLSDALSRLRHVNKPGSLILIISDFYDFDAAAQQHLIQLRQHNELHFFHLYDIIEQDCPKPGLYPISDGHDTFLLDLSDAETRQLYLAHWAERQERLQAQCRKHAIQYTPILTSQDLERYYAK